MEKTFYVTMKISDYVFYINNGGRHNQKAMVKENEIDGFIRCLEVLGYKEI